MNIRLATISDRESIAALHALSWSIAYRGALSDDFLDHDVVSERSELWKSRFEVWADNMVIYIAHDDQELLGVCCGFADHDKHGSMIDNLHVHPSTQGRGLGRLLMSKMLGYFRQNAKSNKMHLYVLEKNDRATEFYHKLGGVTGGVTLFKAPDGSKCNALRIDFQI